jgi:hypothetical protein
MIKWRVVRANLHGPYAFFVVPALMTFMESLFVVFVRNGSRILPLFLFLALAIHLLIGLGLIAIYICLGRRVPRTLRWGIPVIALLLLILGLAIRQQFFLSEPFVTACSANNIEEAKSLLGRGASVDAYGIDFRETALIVAAEQGKIEIVEWLLTNGAKAERTDSRGRTALERAKETKQKDVVRPLESWPIRQ